VNTFKLICLTVVEFFANAFKEWRSPRPPSSQQLEAERLDRIRNPAKYRGKDL
jgi:hypothetical protein